MTIPTRTASSVWDAIVIGGGPGGSTAATMLARKGLRVLLLEREHFPRSHIGESLLPASMPVLEELGVMPAVRAAGFLPKWGATMVWGVEQEPWSWYFGETNQRHPHAFQVWRPEFDRILLENTRAHGVEVREGHQVREVLFDDGRAAGVRYSSDRPRQHGQHTARARFIVDASGQQALLGHKLDVRRWDSFFQNLAVYAYFEGAHRLSTPDETNIFIDSYDHGWFWSIPLHNGWMSVGAVVDSKFGQDGIARTDPERFLRDQIAEAPRTAAMLRGAKLVEGPYVLKDWSYLSDTVAGDGYVLVGDAACFVDPLFSSGVHLAMTSGVLASAYVVTALKDPSMRDAAGRVYQELYYQQYNHFHTLAQLFYSTNRTRDSYFWEARRLIEDSEDLAPRAAFIRAVAGQPPRGYERVVLDRGEAPDVYVRSIHALEADQAARRQTVEQAGEALLTAVPHLAQGARIERKPVLGEGEFVWGQVIVTGSRPEGAECSPLVARLVEAMDGKRSVGDLVEHLLADIDPARQEQIARAIVSAVHILYVDGAIETIEGI